jgi:sortase A
VTLLADAPPPPPPPPSHFGGVAPARPTVAAGGAPSPQRLRLLLLTWLGALVLGLALVMFGFGPLFQDRVQRSMLREYRVLVDQASNGAVDPAKTPPLGSAVGIVEIGEVRVQQAVVEGVRSSDTRKGPGHVPGTAGLGQPGNSVVVGRRSAFGGPFGSIGSLHKGDPIVVTTTQGQSVYTVSSVKEVAVRQASEDDAGTVPEVYGPSQGDQLTLITSGSKVPWNGGRATVVVAKMRDAPFAPTPQGGRSDRDTGGNPDGDAKAPAVLAMLVYGLAMGASVVLYRRMPTRVAYLLTAAPIVALTIITGETFSRLFPAWM